MSEEHQQDCQQNQRARHASALLSTQGAKDFDGIEGLRWCGSKMIAIGYCAHSASSLSRPPLIFFSSYECLIVTIEISRQARSSSNEQVFPGFVAGILSAYLYEFCMSVLRARGLRDRTAHWDRRRQENGAIGPRSAFMRYEKRRTLQRLAIDVKKTTAANSHRACEQGKTRR